MLKLGGIWVGTAATAILLRGIKGPDLERVLHQSSESHRQARRRREKRKETKKKTKTRTKKDASPCSQLCQ
jgi:hypothetical protein